MRMKQAKRGGAVLFTLSLLCFIAMAGCEGGSADLERDNGLTQGNNGLTQGNNGGTEGGSNGTGGGSADSGEGDPGEGAQGSPPSGFTTHITPTIIAVSPDSRNLVVVTGSPEQPVFVR